MKKILALLMALCLVLSMAACGKEEPQADPGQNNQQPAGPDQEKKDGGEEKKEDTPAFEISVEKLNGGERVTFSRMAVSPEDFKKADLKDKYVTAALTVMAFCLYETDPDGALEALEYINGPNELGAYDKSHFKEQFSQYPYVARSYLDGASPENDYTVKTYSVTLTDNNYLPDEKGIARINVRSGGADSERVIQLKQKESTEEWFLNVCDGLLAGIRAPKSQDPWK